MRCNSGGAWEAIESADWGSPTHHAAACATRPTSCCVRASSSFRGAFLDNSQKFWHIHGTDILHIGQFIFHEIIMSMFLFEKVVV